eukprot:TRINITY_DN2805_c0_g1_i2.p2 TRINITY_DN2805_c0_g1~~TRINITY_DN2805_c0_g1_i2.p2  ORF type:complete len:558 (+),score=101.62 TRINITY_DN2805_c0_g1_i2:65-1675(+)
MMEGKRVRNEIDRLVHPQVPQEADFDWEFGDTPQLENFNQLDALQFTNGQAELQSNNKKKNKKSIKQKLNLRGNIEVDAAIYRGKKISRAEYFGDEDEDEGDEISDEEDQINKTISKNQVDVTTNRRMVDHNQQEAESEFEYDEDQGQQQELGIGVNGTYDGLSDAEEEDHLKSREAGFDENHSEDDEDEDMEDELSLQEQEKYTRLHNEEDDDDEEDTEDELKMMEQEHARLQNEDQNIAILAKDRMAKEKLKGKAVKAQRTILDRCLIFRIKLQKAIASSNKLPQPDMHQYVVQNNEDIRNAFKEVSEKSRLLLGDMLMLMDGLVQQNSLANASYLKGVKRRKVNDDRVDGLWKQIVDRQDSLGAFQDQALDRWHKRALLRTGKGAMRADTGELHRGISQQVELVMRNKDKVVKRARLLQNDDGQPPYLCCPSSLFPEKSEEIKYDMETYDDTEFYQGLLKEYLEGAGAAGSEQLISLQRARKKKNRSVDRKASKGRKLRYTVQEKLVNFLLPEQQEIPQFANQLFRNLFGSSY